MVVFGIDPGYAIVGWGAISFKSNTFKALGFGAVETQAHTDFNERLEYIDTLRWILLFLLCNRWHLSSVLEFIFRRSRL